VGLDVANRSKILDILGNLSSRVLLVLRPQDELPEWATDVLELGDMKIKWSGKLEEYKQRKAKETEQKKKYAQEYSRTIPKGGDPVVELRGVNVSYGGRKIIKDLTWTVREGERWALLGPNGKFKLPIGLVGSSLLEVLMYVAGSGKTTLLSLLTGDHPQAYANDMSLFGRKRGTGESIWDIKQRIGLVSPEIHLYFNQQMTALMAAGTGFFDVVVPRKLTSEQENSVRQLFSEFGMMDLIDRKLIDMSTGEQRLVLLVRSLVKSPSLLIWDEPFQGLDEKMIGSVTGWLENHMRPDQTLIVVTHHEEEIPHAVNQRYMLPMLSDKVTQ
jgi:molybdate transport system ATP-binding protein